MIISPLLILQIRPQVFSWVKHSRSIRPSVKICKSLFQLTIDVHNFTKDEIRVKARQEYVIIEGKQEKKTKNGFVLRHFVRKFKLPQGCSPDSMQSKLSPDGILTITAPRNACEPELPCETVIPITFADPCKKVDNDKPSDVKEEKQNPCAKFKEKNPDDKKPT